jgi:hypothetical protein
MIQMKMAKPKDLWHSSTLRSKIAKEEKKKQKELNNRGELAVADAVINAQEATI